MKTYKGAIKRIFPHQIFVFGSNTQGRHGKGAALWARIHAGAIYGTPKGLQGNSYALITKDISMKPYRSMPEEYIVEQISTMYQLATISLKDYEFMVSYKGTGTNLNGYTPAQMAVMFLEPGFIPDNIVFEEDFAKLIEQAVTLF